MYSQSLTYAIEETRENMPPMPANKVLLERELAKWIDGKSDGSNFVEGVKEGVQEVGDRAMQHYFGDGAGYLLSLFVKDGMCRKEMREVTSFLEDNYKDKVAPILGYD